MKREIDESRRAWLVGELDAWRDLGLIDTDQHQAVLGLYATSEELGQGRQSRALGVLFTLGALLLGLGLMLLIAYNWEAMPAAVKVALVLLVLVTTHAVGLDLKFQRGRPMAGEVALFLGCLEYGAGIWLIAQIFHLGAHDGAAWWWWAAGVLPFALVCDSLALHALYALLLAVWVGMEIIGYPDLGAWFFGRWSHLPNGAYGLLLMVAPGFVWSYWKDRPKALALYVPVIAWWAVLQPMAWRMTDLPVHVVGTVGGLLLLVAGLHRKRTDLAIPYRFWGALLVAGVLVPMSFHDFNSTFDGGGPWMRNDGPRRVLFMLVQPMVAVALAAGALAVSIAWRKRGRTEDASWAEELRATLAEQWLPLSIIVGMALLGAWQVLTLGWGPIVPTVAANLAMVALSLWLVQVGLRDDRGLPFGAGVVYFLFWTVLRYIDLFSDFGGMLGAACMFFLCGGALFGVGWYWRRRKDRKAEVTHASA